MLADIRSTFALHEVDLLTRPGVEPRSCHL